MENLRILFTQEGISCKTKSLWPGDFKSEQVVINRTSATLPIDFLTGRCFFQSRQNKRRHLWHIPKISRKIFRQRKFINLRLKNWKGRCLFCLLSFWEGQGGRYFGPLTFITL